MDIIIIIRREIAETVLSLDELIFQSQTPSASLAVSTTGLINPKTCSRLKTKQVCSNCFKKHSATMLSDFILHIAGDV